MKTDLCQFQEISLPLRAARLAPGILLPLGMSLMGCAEGGLDLLRRLTIAVVGCGSVGGRIALLLARLGVGKLLLVDPKRCTQRSLATHEIVPEDVGQPKALAMARRCKAINPASRVLSFVGPVEALSLASLAEANLVSMAPDLMSVEVEVGQRCLWTGTPLVQASVHGASLTVQVRFFAVARGGDAVCPACGYGAAEWDLLSRQQRFSCEGAGDATPSWAASAPATNSLGAICSMAANLAVVNILRFLLRLGQPVGDTLLEYNGFTHRTVISPLARNPKCKLDHTVFARAALDQPLASYSLAQVTRLAAGCAVAPGTQFELAGLDWVELAACDCAQPMPVRRFVPRGSARFPRCAKCSAPRVPLDFYTHRLASASLLGRAVERPLAKLGARRVTSLVLRAGDTGVLVHAKPSPLIMP